MTGCVDFTLIINRLTDEGVSGLQFVDVYSGCCFIASVWPSDQLTLLEMKLLSHICKDQAKPCNCMDKVSVTAGFGCTCSPSAAVHHTPGISNLICSSYKLWDRFSLLLAADLTLDRFGANEDSYQLIFGQVWFTCDTFSPVWCSWTYGWSAQPACHSDLHAATHWTWEVRTQPNRMNFNLHN